MALANAGSGAVNPALDPTPTDPIVAAPNPYAFLAKPTADEDDILAAEVHRILSGGNPTADSPYDRREVRLAVLQARRDQQSEVDRYNADAERKATVENEAFARQQYFDDLDALYKFGGSNEEYLVPFPKWPVLTDPDTDEKYSLLPEVFTKLARHQNLPGEGVYSVEPMKLVDRYQRTYIPIPTQLRATYQGGHIPLDGDYGFTWEGDRVYYVWSRGTTPPPDAQVLLKVIIRATRDTLGEPGLRKLMQTDIVAKAVALLQRRTPEDKTNDNNANQG
ncbi:hypothetical protein [Hymenobacter koreensis]|uniref:Uncharacterized protein n=1 Tax=Hymenobacter koreensis TaxID=1084523 RepID=A0ABP8JJT0_9BACT